jgi:uncharacterized membrane protein
MIKNFYFDEKRKITLTNEGVESVHLSWTIKCSKDDYAKSVKRAANELAAADLENVEKISIILESSE